MRSVCERGRSYSHVPNSQAVDPNSIHQEMPGEGRGRVHAQWDTIQPRKVKCWHLNLSEVSLNWPHIYLELSA